MSDTTEARRVTICGAPKIRRDGSPALAVRGHDPEEFVGVVRRYGADAAKRPRKISRARIRHVCGTCQLRVA